MMRIVDADEPVNGHQGHAEGRNADIGIKEEGEEVTGQSQSKYPIAIPKPVR